MTKLWNIQIIHKKQKELQQPESISLSLSPLRQDSFLSWDCPPHPQSSLSRHSSCSPFLTRPTAAATAATAAAVSSSPSLCFLCFLFLGLLSFLTVTIGADFSQFASAEDSLQDEDNDGDQEDDEGAETAAAIDRNIEHEDDSVAEHWEAEREAGLDDDSAQHGVDGETEVPTSGQEDGGDEVQVDWEDDESSEGGGQAEEATEVSTDGDSEEGEETEEEKAEEQSEGEELTAAAVAAVAAAVGGVRNGEHEECLERETEDVEDSLRTGTVCRSGEREREMDSGCWSSFCFWWIICVFHSFVILCFVTIYYVIIWIPL